MLEILREAEAVYNRIKEGNYSIEYYFHLIGKLEILLNELKQGG